MFRNIQPKKTGLSEWRAYRSVSIGAMLAPLTPIGEDGVRARGQLSGRASRSSCWSAETYLPPSHRRNNHVRITKRSSRYAAIAVGLALVAAACGNDNNGSTSDTAAAPGTTAASSGSSAPGTTAVTETTAGGTATTGAAGTGSGMTLTMNINPAAVW